VGVLAKWENCRNLQLEQSLSAVGRWHSPSLASPATASRLEVCTGD
jgi:hypothetical protein